MNRDFVESHLPEDRRRGDQRSCPFARSLEQPGLGVVPLPPWMQAHLTECLSCLNDFTRLQSLGAGRAAVAEGRLHLVRELGTYVREHKTLWLLPIVVILTLFAGLLLVTQGSAVAPFIFTLF